MNSSVESIMNEIMMFFILKIYFFICGLKRQDDLRGKLFFLKLFFVYIVKMSVLRFFLIKWAIIACG